jgi:hypothetical protein
MSTIIPEGKHDCPIIDSEEDSSSDKRQPQTCQVMKRTRLVVSFCFHQKKNTAYTFVDNKENEESSDDEPLATMKQDWTAQSCMRIALDKTRKVQVQMMNH